MGNKDNSLGALPAEQDRAVMPSAPSPAVSAVPVSIPSAEEVAAVADILARGIWSASVYHCPPAPKWKPKIWNASIARVGNFATLAAAERAANAAVAAGRAGTTLLHGPTSKPLTTFVLPSDGVEKLGAIASAIEARRAETAQTGSVHESAVGASRDAKEPGHDQ